MNFATLLSVLVLFATGTAAARPRSEFVEIAATRATIHLATRPAALLGYQSRPDTPGRHPGVVVLHGCDGFGAGYAFVADTLASWGYVALAPDSLGATNACLNSMGSVAEAQDAYSALRYLRRQPFVDPDRIAVLGYSMGGSAALYAIERGGMERSSREHFRAAVAYYPECASFSGVVTSPTLILIGDKDDWASADACRKMAAQESDIGITRHKANTAPVTLVVYPGATHAFNFRGPARRYLGHLLEYDQAADEDALRRVRKFLQETLGSPPVQTR